jgi:hypothetical protein
MTDRQAIEDLLEEFYAARVRGDPDTVAKLFAANSYFIEFLDTALAAKVLASK